MSNYWQGGLWPGGLIPYEFDVAINTHEWPKDKKDLVIDAMNRWMSRTNFSIIFRHDPESIWPWDHGSVDIYYKIDSTEKSTSTENESNQMADNVDLSSYDNQPLVRFSFVAQHELGHVMGLEHEQQRFDRGTFLESDLACMESYSRPEQFEFEAIPLGPFNSLSVMLYHNCVSCRSMWKDGPSANSFFCPTGNNPFTSNVNQLSLWDGAGIIEAYRWKYNVITPFGPIFDSFPNVWDINPKNPPKDNWEFIRRGDTLIFEDVIFGKKDQTFLNSNPSIVYTKFKNTNSNPIEKCPFLIVNGLDGNVYIRKIKGVVGFDETWRSLGHPARGAFSDPVAISAEDDTIDIFVTDKSGYIYHCYCRDVNGSFRHDGWHKVPGGKTHLLRSPEDSENVRSKMRPAVALDGEGSAMSIFILDFDFESENIIIKTARIFPSAKKVILNSEWVVLDNLLFTPTSSPSAILYKDAGFNFVVITIFGTPLNDEPVAASLNGLNVNMGSNFFQCVWERAGTIEVPPYPAKKIGSMHWADWSHFVGQVSLPGSNPTIASVGVGRRAIYVRGLDGHLVRRWYRAGYGWDPYWWDLGGCLSTDPGVCESLIVAGMGESRKMLSKSFALNPPEIDIPIIIEDVNDIKSINIGIWYKVDVVG